MITPRSASGMKQYSDYQNRTRRTFLTSAACGLGGLALANILRQDNLLAESQLSALRNPLVPKQSQFPARAKNCIFLLMTGGPSQVDLFDPKPVLAKRDGEKIPDSVIEDVEFAFVKKDKAFLKASPEEFRKYGECGAEYSGLLPHIGAHADDLALIRTMHGEQFNHHPAQLVLMTGKFEFGRPTIGSWLVYGLGSESQNLPSYVVLMAGRGASGGSSNWSSGFLPSHYQGIPLRSQGEPILNLANPPGVDFQQQRQVVEAIRTLNRQQYEIVKDPEIESRIAQYELAFRMQAAAPALTDLSGESQGTLDAYGVERATPRPIPELQQADTYSRFARNCLLARRMVERGVRCVSVIHSSWDHHSKLQHDIGWNARMCDQPIGALLTDLKERGLLDETLVVWGSEFGRTPVAESADGRDHHPHAFSMWMAGGGVRPGTVYGKTDDFGFFPAENPVHVHDFQATMLHLFGFDHKKLAVNVKGLDTRLTDQGGRVIQELVA